MTAAFEGPEGAGLAAARSYVAVAPVEQDLHLERRTKICTEAAHGRLVVASLSNDAKQLTLNRPTNVCVPLYRSTLCGLGWMDTIKILMD